MDVRALLLAPAMLLACGGDGDGRATPWPGEGTTGVEASTSSAPPAETTEPGSSTTDPTADPTVDPSGGTETPADLPAVDDCPRVRVVSPDDVLNVRPDPSTTGTPIGTLANGTIVTKISEVEGESIDGNTLWFEIDYLGQSGFISGAFAECTLDEPPEPPDGWYIPLPCGMQATVTQGNMGELSHNGLHAYAFDFGVPPDTPIVAMADGTVSGIYDLTVPGDPCYDGGGPECGPYGNLVAVLHGDGSQTYYKHLNSVQVAVGDEVARGEQVGLSGTTGYSTGRHLHTMRMENCGELTCQSIPLEFVEAGVPVSGEVVVSENCP